MKTTRYLFIAALMAAWSMNAQPAQADPLTTASAAFAKGDLAAAEALAEPLAKGDGARAEACALLSDVRLRQKRSKEAIELMERAAKIDPRRPDYQSRLGVAIAQRMGEINFMQQAVLAGRMCAAFKRSVEIDPNHVPGYIGLSRYYQNAPAIAGGSMQKAIVYAEEARKLDAFSGALELGFIAERQGQLDQALGHYLEALCIHPEQAWLHEQRGHVLEELGRPAEARICFEKAIELDPKRESARKALAGLPVK
jgi:tetratricopeptide (TPR) repeat protein